ncbi:MAG: metal-dependent hydrolase [Anaerolineales bacterium]|nr:metal-dependent hydrolase [Anaerolineales bacterium]
MTGSTHVGIAAAATVALSLATGHSPDAAGWIAVVIGGLAPDIDSGGGTIARPGSLLGRLLPKWLAWMLDQIGLAISGLVRSILGHRTATHWPIWALIMAVLGLNLGWAWLMWFAWGYLWHILGDFCTKSGVPLAGPLWTKDFKWSPLVTGTWPEFVIVAPLCWGFIFWQGWQYIPSEARFWVSRFAFSLLGIIGGHHG